MNKDKIYQYLEDIEARVYQIRAEMQTPDRIVRAGENLQTALDQGGIIHLERGATFEGIGFEIIKETELHGNLATLITKLAALKVRPGVKQVFCKDLFGNSTGGQSVFQLGSNTLEQTTLDSIPEYVTLANVKVLSHRGKAAIEVNSRKTILSDCHAFDVYDPGKQDSKAIVILNTVGELTVMRGTYEAASENIMSGGDQMKIPVQTISNLTFSHLVLPKRPEWETPGTYAVKNLFELKNGHNVLLENSVLKGSWKDGQSGYAFMFTPTRGGSIVGVKVTRVEVSEVGGGFNITGIDSHGISQIRTDKITVSDSKFTIQKVRGSGLFMLLTNGPGEIEIDNVEIETDGGALIAVGDRKRVKKITMMRCKARVPEYGISVAGRHSGKVFPFDWKGNDVTGGVDELIVEGNEFYNASVAFKKNFPNNTYL